MKYMDITSALSSSMGVITLTAVVVIGVTIVGVTLMEKPQQEQIPATHIVVENYSKTVYMYHKGGEPLSKEGMLIMVNGELHTADFVDRSGSAGWTEFKAGDTLLYDSPEMPNAVSLLYSAQGLEGGTTGGAASSATLFEVATNFRVAGNSAIPYYTPTPLTIVPTEPTPVPCPTPDTYTGNEWSLASVCTNGTIGLVKITNGNTSDIPFSWDLYQTGYSGSGIAVHNTDTYFWVPDATKTVRVFRTGKPTLTTGQNSNPCDACQLAITPPVYQNPPGGIVTPNITFDDGTGKAVCLYSPQGITARGTVWLLPNEVETLQTSWKLVAPTGLSNSSWYSDHASSVQASNGYRFAIQGYWPGIRPDDTQVKTHFSANLLDLYSGQPLGPAEGWGIDYYWNNGVCPPPTPTPTPVVCTPESASANTLLLSAAKGSYLKSGTSIQFRTGTGNSNIYMAGGQTLSLSNNEVVRITMDGDQNVVTTLTLQNGNSITGLSNVQAAITRKIGTAQESTLYGTISTLSISKFSGYESTLTLVTPRLASSTVFMANGNYLIIGIDEREIELTDLAPDSSGNLIFAYNPGATAVSYAGGTYNIYPVSCQVTPAPTPTSSPPVVTAAYADTPCIWPPNHNRNKDVLTPIHILGVTNPSGSDVTISIIAITQDEPIEARGDGSFQPDAYGIGTDTAWVRAERSGTTDGRVYEITFRAVNEEGKSAMGTIQVGVPHDQSGCGTGCCPGSDGENSCCAVNSGQYYDSTNGQSALPIVANFIGTPRTGLAPLTVQFNETSSGQPKTGFVWSFGDDTGSLDQNPLHTYTSPGNYTVGVYVSSPFYDDSITKTEYIRITSPTTATPTPTPTPTSTPTPTPTTVTPTPTPTPQGQYASSLYLSAAKGSYLKSGTSIQFKTGTGNSRIYLSGQTLSLSNNEVVRITMNGDQNVVTTFSLQSGSSITGLSNVQAAITRRVGTSQESTTYGTISSLSINKFSGYQSSLRLITPRLASSTVFMADGNYLITGVDAREIQLADLAPDPYGRLGFAYNPGSTALYYASGTYSLTV